MSEKQPEKRPHSKAPGEAKVLCEPCLRGSGWQGCYESLPGVNEGLDCQNCDRPAVVNQPRRNSGTHEPHHEPESKSMREGRLLLAKLQKQLAAVKGTDTLQ